MIVLDYRDKRPIYEQVVEKLEHLIICGGLEANSKMPSVRALAMDLSVNPNTIQRAYAQLEQDGYIYTVIGRGNYVTARSEWQTGKFESLKHDFLDVLQKAHDAGMPKEDLLALIQTVYTDSVSSNRPIGNGQSSTGQSSNVPNGIDPIGNGPTGNSPSSNGPNDTKDADITSKEDTTND